MCFTVNFDISLGHPKITLLVIFEDIQVLEPSSQNQEEPYNLRVPSNFPELDFLWSSLGPCRRPIEFLKVIRPKKNLQDIYSDRSRIDPTKVGYF